MSTFLLICGVGLLMWLLWFITKLGAKPRKQNVQWAQPQHQRQEATPEVVKKPAPEPADAPTSVASQEHRSLEKNLKQDQAQIDESSLVHRSVNDALESHRRLVGKLKGIPRSKNVQSVASSGNYKKSQLNPSGQYNLPVRWNIDYVSQYGEITNRTIRIEHLRLRPLVVEAFCEKRQEYRTFYIAGIKKAVDPASGREVDIESYVRHVRAKRSG